MLQAMRNSSQGIVAKVVVFLIIVVFALWGVESIVSLSGGETPVVDVDGIEIHEAELKYAIEAQKSNLKQQFGDAFNENLFDQKLLRSTALEQLINQKVNQKFATDLGLVASTALVDQTILSIPSFQKDGKFDAQQFRYVLSTQGMSPMGFRQRLADDIKTAQLNQLVAISDFITPAQTKFWTTLLNEKRKIEYKLINSNDFINKVSLNDEQIDSYYKANESRFFSEAKAKINYIQLSLDSLIAEQKVSNEELTSAYEAYKSKVKQYIQRAAHHILIEISESTDDKTALEKANDLYEKIKKGESFEKLASQYSDDLGSKKQSGNLGFAEPGSYDKAFEEALNQLKPGEVSKPVKTEFGYHIIRLDEIKKGEVKSLKSQEKQLTEEIKKQKAELAYSEKIQELTNLSFSAGNLDEVADTLGLKIQASELFTRSKGKGIASNDKVRTQAFAENVLLDQELSPIIELEQSVVVLSVSEYKKAALKPIKEVKPEIETILKRQEAQKMANEKAEALLKADKVNEGWDKATVIYKDKSTIDEGIKTKAFELKSNDVSLVKTETGYAVLKVIDIEHPETDKKEATLFENAITQQRLRELMISLHNWAKNSMEITRYGES